MIRFVTDMNKAVRFYRDTLGLKFKFESPGWSEFVIGCTRDSCSSISLWGGHLVFPSHCCVDFVDGPRTLRWAKRQYLCGPAVLEHLVQNHVGRF